MQSGGVLETAGSELKRNEEAKEEIELSYALLDAIATFVVVMKGWYGYS